MTCHRRLGVFKDQKGYHCPRPVLLVHLISEWKPSHVNPHLTNDDVLVLIKNDRPTLVVQFRVEMRTPLVKYCGTEAAYWADSFHPKFCVLVFPTLEKKSHGSCGGQNVVFLHIRQVKGAHGNAPLPVKVIMRKGYFEYGRMAWESILVRA